MRPNAWKNRGQRAAWIFYQLRLQETSGAALGRKMRPPVSKRVMAYVINGQGTLGPNLRRRVEEALARALGLDWAELWGEGALHKEPDKERRVCAG